ncbi:MAG: MFS transporter [Lachnospiraceae bacterium]|nr:MFS transporter [Lachnospiraceae bacterium]
MIHLLLAVIYLSFISLGLPDSLLGSAWPSMYGEFGVPVSYAGAVSMIIALCTVISSLQSDRLTRMLGTGRVTAVSVAMTAAALYAFSVSHSFWMLCLWAVPYGLGAGSVDASLNNYVALHYKSCHMSWLHCMWGIGASLGPYIMGYALLTGRGWHMGYRYVSLLQIGLTLILTMTLSLWRKVETKNTRAIEKRAAERRTKEISERVLPLGEVVAIPGAKQAMGTFFCYCALEQTAGLWGSSYLALYCGMNPQVAARFAGLFFIGITVGRAISGFLTIRFNDAQMVRLGLIVGAIGVAAFAWPGGVLAPGGLVLLGVGCSPIYPCLMHAAPDYFGADKSQAIIGVQMASAYVGICVMPPLFGILAEHVTMALFPVYLLVLLVSMAVVHERLLKKCGNYLGVDR